jgi:hypothetical protein
MNEIYTSNMIVNDDLEGMWDGTAMVYVLF